MREKRVNKKVNIFFFPLLLLWKKKEKNNTIFFVNKFRLRQILSFLIPNVISSNIRFRYPTFLVTLIQPGRKVYEDFCCVSAANMCIIHNSIIIRIPIIFFLPYPSSSFDGHVCKQTHCPLKCVATPLSNAHTPCQSTVAHSLITNDMRASRLWLIQ